jgi:tetrapyrrole methylase family protein/MazG family protein
LLTEAKKHGMPVRVIEGLSFVSMLSRALGQPITQDWVLVDSLSLMNLEVPDYPPTKPAIITNLTSREQASELKLTLMANYPDEYPVTLVHAAGSNAEIIEPVELWQIDRTVHIGGLTSLYVPPLEAGRSFEDFQQVIARLRAPDGCPWDREQTHMTLRAHLLEEAYEVLQALDEEDPEHLKEELGDLLLQIVLHAQIASEDQEFNMTDVLLGISQKLIRRHPHVFGELDLKDADAVIVNWEKIKAGERKQRGEEQVKGMLDGIPLALPALTQADQIQRRAKRVGFDWQTVEPVIAKIHEELAELEAAETEEDKQAEAGDLLFAAVNLIRWMGIDPEFALRECNARFKRRFGYIEQHAIAQGRTLQELSFEEMDALWNEAKHAQKHTKLEG